LYLKGEPSPWSTAPPISCCASSATPASSSSRAPAALTPRSRSWPTTRSVCHRHPQPLPAGG